MSITFPHDEDHSHLGDPIVFHASTVSGRVTCQVSVATLREADGTVLVRDDDLEAMRRDSA